ncbi:hypothetical protein CHLRE_17g713260v5 [Chlamydomonas reinhardtii]|uniref:Uncharacterized protein n=1 Tax=Chlamydomonas reinhardtii TaxID=3055 RepID=A0A2K3CPS6_CHLRE|nr:uncharacterized protein CHLRE_17g713260v5 [Chlamydomonas reinhardtii]PNW70280.1 hypothetical protein CHLRE_17g713260v5 [Chlamydomonas reinhardtii]
MADAQSGRVHIFSLQGRPLHTGVALPLSICTRGGCEGTSYKPAAAARLCTVSQHRGGFATWCATTASGSWTGIRKGVLWRFDFVGGGKDDS